LIKNNLKQLREAAGLRNVDVADGIGVTPGMVSNYESGKSEVPPERWIKLLKVLKVKREDVKFFNAPDEGREEPEGENRTGSIRLELLDDDLLRSIKRHVSSIIDAEDGGRIYRMAVSAAGEIGAELARRSQVHKDQLDLPMPDATIVHQKGKTPDPSSILTEADKSVSAADFVQGDASGPGASGGSATRPGAGERPSHTHGRPAPSSQETKPRRPGHGEKGQK
jgi:transcriptional regulator with XRE-family HTH domain